jgi:transcriptional regulator with XRE-family HTH domain
MKLVTPLKVYRVAAGLTQRQLADIAGTYQEHLSRLERGTTAPVQEEKDALAAALGVPPEALFDDDGKGR